MNNNDEFLLKSILQEFIELEWNNHKNPIQTINVDTNLKPFTILRKTKDYYTIYFLYNGYSIVIPWQLIDFMSSLDVFAGERILNMQSELLENGVQTDWFILNFIKALRYLETRRFTEFLDCISNICIEKSNNLRDWLEEKYKLFIEPIEFQSPTNTYTL